MKSPLSYTEAELLLLLRQRSEAAFEYLYANYSGALLNIVRTITGPNGSGEDVLQEVFVRIFRKLDLYDEKKSRLYTWMVQIARNAAIDWLRQQSSRPGTTNQKPLEDVYETVNAVNPDSTDLRQWINKLEKPEKVVLVLAYLEGHTQEEISQLLDTPLGTVKSRIRSGLRKMRIMMTEEK